MNFEQLKSFYKTHQLQNENIGPINDSVVSYINSLHPDGVFEFGCNNGKNLRLLESLDDSVGVWGIDINKDTLKHPNTCFGDEETLKDMEGGLYDLVFTCSVLNHIPHGDVEGVISNLCRIARKHVIIAECVEIKNHPRWFSHDYELYGFKKVKDVRQNHANVYSIFRYDIPSIIQ